MEASIQPTAPAEGPGAPTATPGGAPGPGVPPAPLAPLPGTVQPPPVVDAEQKQRNLDRMKRRATGLLVAMTGVFVVTRIFEGRHPWLGYIRATAEAAMVGGVADWFAITALFRHPFGLPIPHTAIVPRRKDRIGRSLGNFVQNNFLARDVLARKLRAARIGHRAAEWLTRPESARSLAGHAAQALRGASVVLRDEDVHAFLDRSVVDPLRRVPIAPVLARGLALLTTDDRHQQLLDRVLQGLARLVAENDELIRERIREETPWWIPNAVDDRIHDKVVNAIENTLADVRANPDHPLRHQFDELLDDFIVKLQEDPRVIARAEELKGQFLDGTVGRGISPSLWIEVKKALAKKAETPADGAPSGLERGLTALGEALLRDEALQEKVDGWVVEAVLAVVEQYRHEVGELIAHTVSSWDPEETSRRIELQVGRDLQFIRINGTLVGGLVGLLIYTVTRLAGGTGF
ncbi:MAG TPA: DUF445 family protein [Gemmatimonadales bacterium]|nr:DUF445 family protein [Gemmatimonadales bacterium]